jgi:hypothetical protein
VSERSYTLPAIRVTLEERDAIKREAESRGLSLSEWVRRASGAEGAQGSGAVPQPSPPEPLEMQGLRNLAESAAKGRTVAGGVPPPFKCPVPDCPYRPFSPAARCPRHNRLVVAS